MNVKNLGSNRTEIRTNRATVFVSYSTPVAAILDGKAYRTEKKWSVTTSRHINRWLDGMTAETKPQTFFDSLLNG